MMMTDADLYTFASGAAVDTGVRPSGTDDAVRGAAVFETFFRSAGNVFSGLDNANRDTAAGIFAPNPAAVAVGVTNDGRLYVQGSSRSASGAPAATAAAEPPEVLTPIGWLLLAGLGWLLVKG